MRRSSRRKKQNSHKSLAISHWIMAVTVLAFGFLVFVCFKVLTLEKFIYLNKTIEGDGEIIIVNSNPEAVTLNGKVIKYLIPAETEFEASNGYGNYKLKSLWVLSEKDALNGKLVADTVTKNFSLPIYLWKDGVKSNLSIYQKIRILLVDENESDYESKITTSKISDSILINFISIKFLESDLKIDIEDLTGTQSTIERVSKIIEVLGGKVSSNSKGYEEGLDCVIIGKEDTIVNEINNIFNCDTIIDGSLSSDLKIRLGTKFTRRF